MGAFRQWRHEVASHVKILVCSFALKLLLTWTHPAAYVSTDYDVHRNWMSIVWQRPLSQWYFEDTNRWTLDYPPLFAYFELLLASLCSLVCPDALVLSPDRVNPPCLPPFHRATMLVCDALLYGAALAVVVAAGRRYGWDAAVISTRCRTCAILICFHAGLIIVDHMHFQYNSLLLAVLLALIACMYADMHVATAVTFTILCCLKHLFVVLGPVVAAHLLLVYVLPSQRSGNAAVDAAGILQRVAMLAAAPLIVVAGAFLPFVIAPGAAQQMLLRMFPFERGLVHDYWAPNAWALYMLLDRITVAAGRTLRARWDCLTLTHNYATTHNATCLPGVSSRAALVIMLLAASLPALVLLAQRHRRIWAHHLGLALAYAGAFMFGWHVHEKAILYALVPLQMLAVLHPQLGDVAWNLAVPATLAQWPLIHTPLEQPALVAVTLAGLSLQWLMTNGAQGLQLVSTLVAATVGIAYVALPIVAPRYEYLPQMLMSTWAAGAIVAVVVTMWRRMLAVEHVNSIDIDKVKAS